MPEIEVTPEHAADPNTRRVGILVGVVGILLSVVTIASHRAHTQAVIHRTESNDQWAYYQAKKIREYTSEWADLLQAWADPAKTRRRRRSFGGPRQVRGRRGRFRTTPGEGREIDVEEHRALRSTSAKACWSSAWCLFPVLPGAKSFSRSSA